MPIENIMAEQAQTGELSEEFIEPVPPQPTTPRRQQAGGQSSTATRNARPRTSIPTDFSSVQLTRRDIELVVDIGILVMLVLIWSRV